MVDMLIFTTCLRWFGRQPYGDMLIFTTCLLAQMGPEMALHDMLIFTTCLLAQMGPEIRKGTQKKKKIAPAALTFMPIMNMLHDMNMLYDLSSTYVRTCTFFCTKPAITVHVAHRISL